MTTKSPTASTTSIASENRKLASTIPSTRTCRLNFCRPAPSPDGKFTAFDLWPQAKYRVVTAFVDFDNVTHPVGERWTFLRKAFLPYEDGLSLFVEENGREVHIRMQSRDDAQGHIVRTFSEYVVEE